MEAKNTQVKKGDLVDLTSEGLNEIKTHKNDYNEMSAQIPSEKRDWRTKDIANLWIGMIVSIAVYQVASGLLVSGMSWKQALFTVVLGHTIVMGVAIALGHFGTKYGLTYSMLSKIVFGKKRNCISLFNKGFIRCFLVWSTSMDRWTSSIHNYWYYISTMARDGIYVSVHIIYYILDNECIYCCIRK